MPLRRNRRPGFGALGIAVAIASLLGTWSAAAGESEHITGPNGLVGWKLTHMLENENEVSETLVIARNGRFIREVHGNPFIWRWIFRDDGKSIAIESGPLHFDMVCVLIDISSGKELERLDCFTYPNNPPPGSWQGWLTKLEGST